MKAVYLQVFLLIAQLAILVFVFNNSPTVYHVAETKMQDLIETEYWSHTNSDDCDYECRTSKVSHKWIGENLYMGDSCDLRYAIDAWETSEAHLEILDHEYDEGVLLIRRDGDVCYIVFNVKQ